MKLNGLDTGFQGMLSALFPPTNKSQQLIRKTQLKNLDTVHTHVKHTIIYNILIPFTLFSYTPKPSLYSHETFLNVDSVFSPINLASGYHLKEKKGLIPNDDCFAVISIQHVFYAISKRVQSNTKMSRKKQLPSVQHHKHISVWKIQELIHNEDKNK